MPFQHTTTTSQGQKAKKGKQQQQTSTRLFLFLSSSFLSSSVSSVRWLMVGWMGAKTKACFCCCCHGQAGTDTFLNPFFFAVFTPCLYLCSGGAQETKQQQKKKKKPARTQNLRHGKLDAGTVFSTGCMCTRVCVHVCVWITSVQRMNTRGVWLLSKGALTPCPFCMACVCVCMLIPRCSKVLKKDAKRCGEDIFLDFENAQPTEEERHVYDQVKGVLDQSVSILEG